MNRPRTRFTFALAIALTSVVIAAQEPNSASGPKNTPNVTLAIDQLVEQNQRLEKQNQQIVEQNQQLEKQNQQLMEQINVLRGNVAQPANVSEKAPAPASAQATASGKKTTVSVQEEQAAQNTVPSRTNVDDKTAFLESSNGNPAIFGEFNPGRGFTVGRGE